MRTALCLFFILGFGGGYGHAQTTVERAIMRLDTPEKVIAAETAWSTRTGKVFVGPRSSLIASNASLGIDEFYKVLDRLPFIKLIVVPTPPHDYSITINGMSVEPTELSEYAFPRGTIVDLSVKRSNYPACNWHGRMEKNEQVTCRLP